MKVRRSIRSLLAGMLAAGSIALVLPASPVQAENVTLTIVDADGNAIPRAMVAFVDADGVALTGAIADDDGKVTIDDTAATGFVVAAPGYQTLTSTNAPGSGDVGGSVTLTSADSSAMSYSNAYGAQVSGVFADGEAGVFYITTDGIPSVWRTMDYAGTWAPVPTTASSDDGIPQSGAGGLATSGYPGEVAVVVQEKAENGGNQSKLYYSKDFGTTWNSMELPGGDSRPVIRWAHSVDGETEASVIMVSSEDGGDDSVSLADMTVDIPVLTSLTLAGGIGPGIMDLAAADGKVFLVRSDTSNTEIASLSFGVSWSATTVSTIGTLKLDANSDRLDSIEVATLGATSTFPDTVFLYEVTGEGNSASGEMKVATYNGTSWSVTSDLASQGGNNDNPFDQNWDNTYTTIGSGANAINFCGENGTGTAISIAPIRGADDFSNFSVVGTVGNCMWGLNASGGAVDWPSSTSAGSAQVANNEIGLVYLDGVNNNTGFAWSGGYDFSTDMVAIAPNEAGIAKTANIDAHRPEFSSRGARDRAAFINDLASAGAGTDSGGIAINGLTAAVVRDIAMDPNDATGQNYALITSPGGGSRVLLTTDGGESFSTVTGAGGEAMDWWNGDGIEYMAAFAGLNGELSIKPFDRAATGNEAWQMSEELAMTAAEREADVNGFAFAAGGGPGQEAGLRPELAYDGQNQTYLVGMAKGNAQNSALVGVTGTNKILMAASTISQGGGSVDATYSAGSVGIFEFAIDSDSKEVTEARFTIFGKGIDSAGGAPYTSIPGTQDGAYKGGVTSIAYCPLGSAPSVADNAYITVRGDSNVSSDDDGLYVIEDVSTDSPAHSAVTADYDMTDIRVDCDTGLIVGVVAAASQSGGGGGPPPVTDPNSPGGPGVYMSTDGGASFVQMLLAVSEPDTLDVQADAESGEVTIVVAGGQGDVTSVEMDETDLGVDLQEMAEAPENAPVETPDANIEPPVDGVTELNDAENGINTGGVADIALPPDANDVALEEEASNKSSRRAAKVGALATSVSVSIGSSSGAFEAQVGASTSSGGGDTGGGDTGGGSFTPLSKPERLMDTRPSGNKVGAIDGTGSAYELQVGGQKGVPSTGVAAVALNVTVVDGEAGDFGGFVTVYPCGTRPDASNLNFTSGQTIPNSVIAPVSSSGKVCFYVYGKAHLLADVSGYFTS
jgi:hypothetical protein